MSEKVLVLWPETVARVFTEENLEVLEVIVDSEGVTVKEIYEELDREKESVKESVKQLFESAVIDAVKTTVESEDAVEEVTKFYFKFDTVEIKFGEYPAGRKSERVESDE